MSKIIKGSAEWARFKDIIDTQLGIHQDFTVIAQVQELKGIFSEKEFETSLCTLSYLAENKENTLKDIFSSDTWDVQFTEGDLSVWKEDSGNIVNNKIKEGNTIIFITKKNPIGAFPEKWVLWPTFENYFNLRYDINGNLMDPYNEEIVVRIPKNIYDYPVSIKTDYLQDIMA